MRYKLLVKEGHYESDNLFRLFWEVIKHRFWHWRRGEGWVD